MGLIPSIMAKVNFFTEDISYNLREKTKIRSWINTSVISEGFGLNELNFIFCSDAYLLRINQDYLQHDDYTDVITFDNAESPGIINGDIFISLERIFENAASFDVKPLHELCRVMIHGTLHLLGYKDKSPAHKQKMTAREDHYLLKLKELGLKNL